MNVKKYNNLDEVLLASIDDSISFEDVQETTVVCVSEDGDEMELSYEEYKESIEEQGLWGFVDNENTIHVWFEEGISLKELIHFFGHEIGHKVGKPFKDTLKEELRAETYGDTAELAYDLAIQTLAS